MRNAFMVKRRSSCSRAGYRSTDSFCRVARVQACIRTTACVRFILLTRSVLIMRAARFILVVMLASEAPQFSRAVLLEPGCCRTMGGGLTDWSGPSTAEAIAAKRVHDFPMNHTACAAHCAALKRCTHFELNMHDQPVHSDQGVCSVFASGGYPVTTACRDSSSGRPRMHCFEVSGGGSSPQHTPAAPASMIRSTVLFGAIGLGL